MIISDLRTRFFGVCVFGALAFLPAWADAAEPTPDEQQRAMTLFEKGRKLAKDGRCSDAIAPLLESIHYAEGVGPLLNLGNCYETLGKTASAHKYFVRALEVAEKRDDKRRDEAAQRAKSIEKELSAIVVHVPRSIRDVAEVKIDGESVPKDHWDLPTFVDPGPHDIDVVAPPNPKQSDTITVRGKADRVEWTAPAPIVDSSSSSSTTTGADRSADGSNNSSKRRFETVEAPSSAQRTIGLVMGGAGLVGLTAGGIFGVIALTDHSSVTGQCPRYPQCDPANRASLDVTNHNAESAGNIATIAVIAGAVLLIGGAILYFTAPHAVEPKTRSAR